MQVIHINVERGNGIEEVISNNYVLYLNLDNQLIIEQNKQESIMGNNDIVLILPDTKVTLKKENALFVCLEIDQETMNTIFPNKRFRFLCDSTMDKSDNYILLCQHLTKYIQYYYENNPYRNAILAKQAYEILIFLVSNFSIGEVASEENDITKQLVDYIEKNYKNDISLKQISSDFYMTPPYFSKFFKTQMGTTFYKYLMSVRLQHAIKLLLETENNVLKVAMDSGFPNAEVF